MTEEIRSRKRKRAAISPAGMIFKAVLIILLVINLVTISMGRSYGSSTVGIVRYSLIPILSDSMSPKIKSGDAVLVKQVDYEEIVPGDIVVYAKDGDLIIHEVIEKDDDQFVAKGIDNTIEDEPVRKEQYKAKFLFRIPLLGGIWRISGNPFKFGLLALLIGLILFGDQIFSAIYIRVFDKESGEISEENNTLDKE